VIYREHNPASFRTALVMDDGHIVCIFLLPQQPSSIPGSGDYLRSGHTFLYRHKRSIIARIWSPRLGVITRDLLRLSRSSCGDKGFRKWVGYWGLRAILISHEKDIRPLAFKKPPEMRLLWADSGHSVALFLNREPWAFIRQDKDEGYSKGVLRPTVGNAWDQKLFENTFEVEPQVNGS